MKPGVTGMAALCLGVAAALHADTGGDSLRLVLMEPLTIHAEALRPGQSRAELGGAPVERVLQELGVAAVRRGGALTGDLAAGPFLRGDVELLLDGERHPAACPNRMDNAATRVNPADLERVDVLRTCCEAGCGLGGLVKVERRQPGQRPAVDLELGGSTLAAGEQSLALGVEGHGLRLSGRRVWGDGFEDGDGRSWRDLFPYADDADYHSDELSLRGARGEWSAGASWTVSEDVPFPYLQMDERETRHGSAHLARGGHRLYANGTSHLMDNGLRTMNGLPLAAPTMVSDADNSIVGLSGPGYHLSWYRWTLDNHFNMSTPSGPMRLDNDMIPGLSQLSAELRRNLRGPLGWTLSLRLGVVRDQVGEEEAMRERVSKLTPDPDTERLFLVHGLGLQHKLALGPVRGSLLLESAGEDPALESLWMSLKKPGANAWWLGNPELETALRHTARTRLALGRWEAELALSRVNRYATLAAARFALTDSTWQAVQTWREVGADLAEAQLAWRGTWLSSRASFVWGRETGSGKALPEMAPASVASTLQHTWRGTDLWLRHTWTAAQRRVSEALQESPTGAWNRLDLGLGRSWPHLELAVELENALDHTFHQHLSYARNPFSAGMPVPEPGRTLRLRLRAFS